MSRAAPKSLHFRLSWTSLVIKPQDGYLAFISAFMLFSVVLFLSFRIYMTYMTFINVCLDLTCGSVRPSQKHSLPRYTIHQGRSGSEENSVVFGGLRGAEQRDRRGMLGQGKHIKRHCATSMA